MFYQDQHTMVLVAEHEDGSQEWHCPTCGRRFIMHLSPDYKRTILEEGDSSAIHSGSMNGLSMGPMTAQPEEAQAPIDDQDCPDCPGGLIEIDDRYLDPFKAWLEKRDA